MSDTASPGRPGADPFPRWFLVGAGSLMLFAILAAASARYGWWGDTQAPAPATQGMVEILFVDQPDKTMRAERAADGRMLELLPADGSGFIRGVVRSLLRQRMLSGQTVNQSFHLIRREDGRHAIYDPVTRTRLEVDGFGPTNSEAFARLYRAGMDGQTQAVRR